MDLERHAVLGDDRALLGRLADDVLRDIARAAARAQLDDRAVEPREADDRLGELLAEGAQAVAVGVDHRGAAEHVAGEAGQVVAGAVDEPIRVVGAGQAELGTPREGALDAPAEQGAVDLREAVGEHGDHAEHGVVGVGDREAELLAVVVGEAHVLAGRQREIRDPAGVDIAAATGEEGRGEPGDLDRSHEATRRACVAGR